MKNCLLLLALFAYSSQVLICQTSKTVDVVTPGSLSSLLTASEKATINNLTVTGTIDSLDFVTMNQMYQLEYLDLSTCSVTGNRIPKQAFYFALQLSSVNLPSTVTKIGDESFFYCTDLTSVILPQNLISIGNEAFLNCRSLLKIELPEELESIGRNAFMLCRALKEINFPSSLQVISLLAFYATSIDSFDIPASVTSIELEALATDSLTYINVDPSNNFYSSIDGVLFNKDKTELLEYPWSKQETEYTIPSTVKVVSSLGGGKHLQSVHIPASVEIFKYGRSFESCYNLSIITVSNDNHAFKSIDNVLYNFDLSRLIRFAPDQSKSIFVMPQQVQWISDYAFTTARNLERIEFSNSIDSIGKYCFSYCEKLDSVVLPETIRKIDASAFINCIKLSSIVLPESLNDIGNSTFSGCLELSSIKFPSGLDSVGYDVTLRCSAMNSITIPSTMQFFGYTNLNDCSDLDTIKINSFTPPIVGDFYFDRIDTITPTLYVPQGNGQAYADDPFWGVFTIEEFEFFLNTSNRFADINYEGGNGGFTIESNSEWNISSDQNWLHLNTAKGMDKGKISFIVDANTGSDRQAIITVNGFHTEPALITVEQSGNPTATKENENYHAIRVYVCEDRLIVENAKNQMIIIYSLNGSSLKTKKATSDYEEMNISKFPSGLYLIEAGDRKVKINFSPR